MRCLKSVHTDRRDNYNRLMLKGIIVGFAAFCVICITHNLLFPEKFTNNYPWISVFLLFALYPMHKLIQYLLCFPFLDFKGFTWQRHFYVIPCLHLKKTKVIPKWLYICSLVFPFFFILGALIFLTSILPIVHDWLFLCLLAYLIGMSSLNFIIIKKIWATPRKCYIEHAKNGVSILISD